MIVTPTPISLPYFDLLLQELDRGNPDLQVAFGRHVHWGYWPDPARAQLTPTAFAAAAEQLTREVYGAAQVGTGQSILDVGCGFGGTIASLNDQFTDLQLTGLNIDPRQLAQAERTVTAQPGNTITWVEGNACALPFPDASFDRVLAVECIFHFPDRRQFFQEALRVLKPGGYLALSDFVPDAWFVPVTQWDAQIFQKSGFYGQMNLRYPLDSYRQLAADVGFTPQLERDITPNTLPTYPFLFQMGLTRQPSPQEWAINLSAAGQTLLAATVSHLHWVRYMILAYQKPTATP